MLYKDGWYWICPSLDDGTLEPKRYSIDFHIKFLSLDYLFFLETRSLYINFSEHLKPYNGEPSQLGLWNTLTASLQRIKTRINKCPEHDINCMRRWGSNSKVSRLQSTPSLPLLLSWLSVVVLVRVSSVAKKELFNHLLRIIIISYSKVDDRSRGRPEGSLSNSYYTEE